MIKQKRIKELVDNMGFKHLNPTQQSLIESKSDNKILISATGSGKTFAFLLCAVEYLEQNSKDILILAPSRELSSQIEDVFRISKSGYNVTCCYGGHSIHIEKRSLDYSPRVIVGTPGRILDHIRKNNFNFKNIGMLIFDEFDKLLEFGFDDEMNDIVSALPNIDKRILASATKCEDFPKYIDKDSFEVVHTEISNPENRMQCKRVECGTHTKLETLFTLMCKIANEPTIVFCNFREVCEEVSDYMFDLYLENEYFHGGMEQFDREKALTKFKNGSCNVLVSTDLAARGIDISDVKNIVHYHIPETEETFIHRNGRTARIDKAGNVYLIVENDTELPEWTEKIQESETLNFSKQIPELPNYKTIYFGMGKKDKLSRIDIVGFLCQKGGIQKSDIGLIELKDHHCFVAVKEELAKQTVKRIFSEKIKGKRTKIAISK